MASQGSLLSKIDRSRQEIDEIIYGVQKKRDFINGGIREVSGVNAEIMEYMRDCPPTRELSNE